MSDSPPASSKRRRGSATRSGGAQPSSRWGRKEARRSEASSSSASSTGPAAATKIKCGALSMRVKASAHSGDATWCGLGLGLGSGDGLASRVACNATARASQPDVPTRPPDPSYIAAKPAAHHLWNRFERSDHRHGLALPLRLSVLGKCSLGDLGHGRTAACHWARGVSAALPSEGAGEPSRKRGRRRALLRRPAG